MKKVLLLFAAVAALVACGTKEPKVDLTGEWNIVRVGETVIADSVENALLFQDSTYHAFVGCNRIQGAFSQAEGIVLAEGLATRMYCEGLMELEHELCVLLPQVKQVATTPCGKTALQNEEGETLIVIEKKAE